MKFTCYHSYGGSNSTNKSTKECSLTCLLKPPQEVILQQNTYRLMKSTSILCLTGRINLPSSYKGISVLTKSC